MTQGFYEQLGVRPNGDPDVIKAAYGRAVAHLLRRREATVARGGDTGALDLVRAQLDEAWAVLSDPARRRRYDAMLAVAGDGVTDAELEGLWPRVAGAMIHPAVAAAARVVDASTRLKLSPLPEPPRPALPRGAPEPILEDEAVTTPSTFGIPRPLHRSNEPPTDPSVADVITMAPPATVRVVGAERAGQVVHLPRPPAVPLVSREESETLADRLGYGGALLTAAREQRGVSIQQLSETTRISARYLEALEKEDFDALPPGPPFVRGYVREVARVLQLDVDRVVAGYMRRFHGDA